MKADANVRNMKGHSPLNVAKDEQGKHLLMKNGADGYTPQMFACESNDLDEVQMLLNQRCDNVSCNRMFQTATHIAAGRSNVDVVRALADLSAKDAMGRSALQLAKDFDVRNQLMMMGADGQTPLMVMILGKNAADVNALIDSKAEVLSMNEAG